MESNSSITSSGSCCSSGELLRNERLVWYADYLIEKNEKEDKLRKFIDVIKVIQYVCENKYTEVTNDAGYADNISIAITTLDAARYQSKLGLPVCLWSIVNRIANLDLRLDQLSRQDVDLIARVAGVNIAGEKADDGVEEQDEEERIREEEAHKQLLDRIAKTQEQLGNENSDAAEWKASLVFDDMVLELQRKENARNSYRSQRKRNGMLVTCNQDENSWQHYAVSNTYTDYERHIMSDKLAKLFQAADERNKQNHVMKDLAIKQEEEKEHDDLIDLLEKIELHSMHKDLKGQTNNDNHAREFHRICKRYHIMGQLPNTWKIIDHVTKGRLCRARVEQLLAGEDGVELTYGRWVPLDCQTEWHRFACSFWWNQQQHGGDREGGGEDVTKWPHDYPDPPSGRTPQDARNPLQKFINDFGKDEMKAACSAKQNQA